MSRGTRTGAKVAGQNCSGRTYRCADGVDVLVPSKAFRRSESGSESARAQMTHANRVCYGRSQKETLLFVSGTELAQDM